MQTYLNQEIDHLVWIGFCQPKFYKQSVWKKAKVIMNLACTMNIGVYYKPHRGAAHYWTADEPKISIEEVIWALVQEHGDPQNPFIVKGYTGTFRVFDLKLGAYVNGVYTTVEEASLVCDRLNRDIGAAA